VATLIDGGLLLAGGLVAALWMSNEVPEAAERREEKLMHAYSCPVEGPRLETIRLACS
jgi:hypothetical protein